MTKEIIYIEWVDTIGDPEQGWKDSDSTDDFFSREDNVVREVGFVWDEDENYLCLVGKYMPSEESSVLTAHRTKIPKAWIIKRVSLVDNKFNLNEND